MNIRRHAFTLIELLVVISIIALMIAILLPALRQARVAARQAACLSQLRQLNLALFMYLDDYDNMPPPTFESASPTKTAYNADWSYLTRASGAGWYVGHGLLYGQQYYPEKGAYINDLNTYVCPDMKEPYLGRSITENIDAMKQAAPITISAQFAYVYRALSDGYQSDPIDAATNYSLFSFSDNARPNDPVIFPQSHEDGYNVVYYDGSGQFVAERTQAIDMYTGFVELADESY